MPCARKSCTSSHSPAATSATAVALANALRTGLAALLSWPAIHLAYTVIDGLTDTGETADAAVVLGSQVNPDGSLFARLEQRLRGGLGCEGYLEGDRMRDYLRQHGVPAAAIITDKRRDTTYYNRVMAARAVVDRAATTTPTVLQPPKA